MAIGFAQPGAKPTASQGRGQWGSQPCHVDITGWEKKVKDVKATAARVCEQVVTWGLDQLMKRTVQHVTGPRYTEKYEIIIDGKKRKRTRTVRGPLTNAGVLPVPVVTSKLRRSIKTIRFNTVFGAVWSDPRMAKYNVFVHNGTKWMKPRPFLQSAVDIERPRIIEFMKKRILEEVSKAGGQGSLF